MPWAAKAAFQPTIFTLPLSSILPRHIVDPKVIRSVVFRQIKSSIQEIGIIEPLAVYPQDERGFLLLDGHLRLEALKQLGHLEVKVLLATDEEGYTYNKRVNHIPPVAQHFMILEALKRGVPEKRIAAAFYLYVYAIRARARLLEGICPEVVEMLKDRHACAALFSVHRKMQPAIQIANVEKMI